MKLLVGKKFTYIFKANESNELSFGEFELNLIILDSANSYSRGVLLCNAVEMTNFSSLTLEIMIKRFSLLNRHNRYKNSPNLQQFGLVRFDLSS